MGRNAFTTARTESSDPHTDPRIHAESDAHPRHHQGLRSAHRTLYSGDTSRSGRSFHRDRPHPYPGQRRILLQDLKRNERHHYGKRIRPDPHHERTGSHERAVRQSPGSPRSRPLDRLRRRRPGTLRDPDRRPDRHPPG